MHVQLDLPMPEDDNQDQFRADVYRVVAEYGAKFDERLLINIVLYPKENTKLDIKSKVSSLINSLENAGCFDSEQIYELVVTRQASTPEGKCMVIIMPIEWSTLPDD